MYIYKPQRFITHTTYTYIRSTVYFEISGSIDSLSIKLTFYRFGIAWWLAYPPLMR